RYCLARARPPQDRCPARGCRPRAVAPAAFPAGRKDRRGGHPPPRWLSPPRSSPLPNTQHPDNRILPQKVSHVQRKGSTEIARKEPPHERRPAAFVPSAGVEPETHPADRRRQLLARLRVIRLARRAAAG